MRDKLPDLRAIVQYGEEEVEHDGVVSWEEFQVENDADLILSFIRPWVAKH